jgi:outer membrane protein W
VLIFDYFVKTFNIKKEIMKKTFLCLIIFVFTSSLINAQGLYVKLGVGYTLGVATSEISRSEDTSTTEAHYGSYGEGIVPALSVGYLFNDNIGIEVGGTYLIGKRFEHDHVDNGITETHKQWGEGILISPSLMLQAPMKNVTPYARFGGVIGLVKVKEEETQTGTGARTEHIKLNIQERWD